MSRVLPAAVIFALASALASALAASAQDDAIERFEKYIRSDDDASRAAVVASLSSVDTPSAVAAIATVLGDESWRVRGAALRVLSGYRSPETVEAIEELAFGRGRADERALALEALGDIGAPSSRAGLVEAADDRSWEIRRAAAQSLGQWAVRHAADTTASAGRVERAALLPPLLALLEDDESVVRTLAAEALGRVIGLGVDGIEPGGASGVTRAGDADAGTGADRTDADPDDENAPPDPALRLLAALDDEAWQVRAAAIRSLQPLRDRRAIGPLIEIVGEEGRLSEDAAKTLESLTGMAFGVDPDAWKRWWERNEERFEVPDEPAGGSARIHRGGGRPPSGSRGVGGGGGVGGAAGAPAGGAGAGGSRPRYAATARYYGIPTPSQRILFLLDVSRSMKDEVDIRDPERLADRSYSSGKKIEIAKQELIRAIEGFNSRTAINILVYHTTVDRWQKKLVPMSSGNKRSAIRFIEEQEPRGVVQASRRPGRGGAADLEAGRTNIWEALSQAFRASGIGTYDRHYGTAVDTIFLLSDGEPTAGELTRTEEITAEIARLNSLRRVVIHTINFGKDPGGAGLLRKLADDNDGTYVDLVGVSGPPR